MCRQKLIKSGVDDRIMVATQKFTGWMCLIWGVHTKMAIEQETS